MTVVGPYFQCRSCRRLTPWVSAPDPRDHVCSVCFASRVRAAADPWVNPAEDDEAHQ